MLIYSKLYHISIFRNVALFIIELKSMLFHFTKSRGLADAQSFCQFGCGAAFGYHIFQNLMLQVVQFIRQA